MKAHSSKHLTAAHSSMALVTTALQDGCTLTLQMDVPITYLGRSHRRITFTMEIEKQALIPSFILSSPNHITSTKTEKPKPVFYSAKMNKLSLSPQKQ